MDSLNSNLRFPAIGMPVEDESLRLEWALTLGWKAALTEEVSEPFVQAATYDYFSFHATPEIPCLQPISLTLA